MRRALAVPIGRDQICIPNANLRTTANAAREDHEYFSIALDVKPNAGQVRLILPAEHATHPAEGCENLEQITIREHLIMQPVGSAKRSTAKLEVVESIGSHQ